MNSVSLRSERLHAVLPVLAALVFHAIALDRWGVTLVAMAALVTVFFRRQPASLSLRGWLVVGGAGFMAGLAIPIVEMLPSALMSPAVYSGLTGLLIGISVVAILASRPVPAWLSAWLLVAVCGQVDLTPGLGVSLGVFVCLALFVTASRAGVFYSGIRSLLPLSLFAAIAAVAASATVMALWQLDDVVVKALDGMMSSGTDLATSGIGEDITIRARSKMTVSQHPLLEVSAQTGLLRVRVLDQFDGDKWSTSRQLRRASHRLSDVPVRPDDQRQLELTPLSDLDDLLPSPAGTWAVSGADPRVEGGWVLRGAVEAAELTLTGDAKERLPEEAAGPVYLAVPEKLREALAPFAEELTGEAATDREKAKRLAAFFQNNFEYSLETNLTGPDPPLVTLIRERRPAYCVYFASAMAVLLQTQGIPARLVSGYVPAEVNPLTGRVTIRQRDAHAWVEVWLEEEGRFVAFDPTPGSSRENSIGHSGPPGIVSALTGAIRSFARRTWSAVRRDPVGWLATTLKSPLLWLLLAVAAFAYVLRRRFRIRASTDRPLDLESPDPVLRESYRRYIAALQTVGIASEPSETDEEIIIRLSDTADPAIAASASEFIARYRRARFSDDIVDEQLLNLAGLGLADSD